MRRARDVSYTEQDKEASIKRVLLRERRYVFREEQEAGGALLFRGLSQSIIGAEGFQGRVRDGIVCRFLAIPTSLLPLFRGQERGVRNQES